MFGGNFLSKFFPADFLVGNSAYAIWNVRYMYDTCSSHRGKIYMNWFTQEYLLDLCLIYILYFPKFSGRFDNLPHENELEELQNRGHVKWDIRLLNQQYHG